jgi:hypothetical protein
MANWRLAESLKKLREQINAEFPDRSKASDGSIGDAAHSARTSDHNPNEAGVVCAIDVTHDPKAGCTGDHLAAALVKSRDPRIKYVIWNRRIIKAYKDKGKIPAWTWQKYTGPNAHSHHIHISVKPEKITYDDRAEWDIDLDIAVVADAEPEAAEDSEAIQQSGADDTASQPLVTPSQTEKIAIEKPPPQYFGTKMRNKIAGLTGGNFGLQAIRDWSEQAKLFGLSARFWFWVSLIALVGTAVYLITQFYRHKVETKRDLELTQQLIQANSTPTNVVELVDSEKLSTYEKLNYKIIRR